MFQAMRIHGVLHRRKIRRAQKILDRNGCGQFTLDYTDLERMQKQYKAPPVYGYDIDKCSKRGRERAKEMIKLLNGFRPTVLELGCHDGMVSYWICKLSNAYADATDIEGEEFYKLVLCKNEVNLFIVDMEASKLLLSNESYNLVFSYDGFEHFANPGEVLCEAVRVLKPGGYIYLHFGPLFNAPLGLHAYRSITVPYCQHLFDKKVLNEFIVNNGLNTIDYGQINGKTLGYFRSLFRNNKQFRVVKYHEIPDARYLNLIMQYPECFQLKDIDEYVVSHIEVLLRKEPCNA